MALRARVGGARAAAPAPVNTHPLTFNQIKNKPGLYEHRNGKVLIVSSSDNKLVQDAQVRTGLTRTGMLMYQDGKLRKVVCDRGPDGDQNWRGYADELTLSN